jgi:hypothetical protein
MWTLRQLGRMRPRPEPRPTLGQMLREWSNQAVIIVESDYSQFRFAHLSKGTMSGEKAHTVKRFSANREFCEGCSPDAFRNSSDMNSLARQTTVLYNSYYGTALAHQSYLRVCVISRLAGF